MENGCSIKKSGLVTLFIEETGSFLFISSYESIGYVKYIATQSKNHVYKFLKITEICLSFL